jgi:hypothetical protein
MAPPRPRSACASRSRAERRPVLFGVFSRIGDDLANGSLKLRSYSQQGGLNHRGRKIIGNHVHSQNALFCRTSQKALFTQQTEIRVLSRVGGHLPELSCDRFVNAVVISFARLNRCCCRRVGLLRDRGAAKQEDPDRNGYNFHLVNPALLAQPALIKAPRRRVSNNELSTPAEQEPVFRVIPQRRRST